MREHIVNHFIADVICLLDITYLQEIVVLSVPIPDLREVKDHQLSLVTDETEAW